MVNDTVTLGVRMDRIRLSVPPGREFHGTLRLVVGGIGARSQLTYEQVNELQLAVESLVAHRNARGDAVVVQAGVDDRGVYLPVGPLAAARCSTTSSRSARSASSTRSTASTRTAASS